MSILFKSLRCTLTTGVATLCLSQLLADTVFIFDAPSEVPSEVASDYLPKGSISISNASIPTPSSSSSGQTGQVSHSEMKDRDDIIPAVSVFSDSETKSGKINTTSPNMEEADHSSRLQTKATKPESFKADDENQDPASITTFKPHKNDTNRIPIDSQNTIRSYEASEDLWPKNSPDFSKTSFNRRAYSNKWFADNPKSALEFSKIKVPTIPSFGDISFNELTTIAGDTSSVGSHINSGINPSAPKLNLSSRANEQLFRVHLR